MIEPARADDAFLADVARTRAITGSGACALWWLGQSGFLAQHAGRQWLIDPYLSDSLTKKYANTDKPHVRMTRRVVDPRRLSGIDAVSASHAHTDHFDAETLRPLLANNPRAALVFPEALRDVAVERTGLSPNDPRLVGIDAGQRRSVAGMAIHAAPAAHETIETDHAGHCRCLGYVIEIGRWRIYHSGDTIGYDGMEDLLRPFAVDVALLPINGRAPERRVAGNLWGREAAALARAINAKLAVPCHFEMFAFNTASADEFVASCRELSQPHQVVRAGQRLTLSDAHRP